MRKMRWRAVMIGSAIGLIVAILGMVSGRSAIQEAAAAALGLALSVAPYCFARAFDEIKRKDFDDEKL